MVDWLQYAEDHDEKVHIIGHHPPRMCMFSFHSMFNRIVQRYQRTIAAQFFAHTHNDEFSIYYADDNATQPVRISSSPLSTKNERCFLLTFRFPSVTSLHRSQLIRIRIRVIDFTQSMSVDEVFIFVNLQFFFHFV